MSENGVHSFGLEEEMCMPPSQTIEMGKHSVHPLLAAVLARDYTSRHGNDEGVCAQCAFSLGGVCPNARCIHWQTKNTKEPLPLAV